MNPTWALSLSAQDAVELGGLRCLAEVEIREAGETLWLRGERSETLEALEVQRLPATGRFHVSPDQHLVPVGKRLPAETMPLNDWVSLKQWMNVETPPSALAGRTEQTVLLSVRPGGDPAEPGLVITSSTEAAGWADDALQIRLERLKVAVDTAQQRVAFLGKPLPEVSGPRYTVEGQVALPAGYEFDPPLAGREVAELLQITGPEIAVFDQDGGWSVLSEDVFVAATRGTLRNIARSANPHKAGGQPPCI